MVLTIHHMDRSQSERILWLCEELDLPYTITHHARDPTTALSPDSLKAVHPSGTSPVFIDDDAPPHTSTDNLVVLAESGAIVEYIINVHGGGRLAVKPGEKDYAEYLNWFHYANGSLQPTMGRYMLISRMAPQAAGFMMQRLERSLGLLEERLKKTGAYLVGEEFTAADIMSVFTLTTMRGFAPVDLGGYEHILAYLERVSKREGYRRAMEKGDPGLEPLIGAKVDAFKFG